MRCTINRPFRALAARTTDAVPTSAAATGRFLSVHAALAVGEADRVAVHVEKDTDADDEGSEGDADGDANLDVDLAGWAGADG